MDQNDDYIWRSHGKEWSVAKRKEMMNHISLELGPDDAEALCLRGAYRKIGRYGYSLEDLNR
ncbi:hypothetical protein C2G38_2164358 [Gigaspora rosea]|uniref:Uncharacterized protein n=1 Tax=Gigaspora rosea TaxID=44941 RepID=A0A397VVU0_9GLOM|nr:hypothetical protein C2G38_2164358 [Gigaspora rosea]